MGQVEEGHRAPSKTPPLDLQGGVGHQQQTKEVNGHVSPSCSIETEEGKTKEAETNFHRLDPPHFLLPSWRLLRILRDPSSKQGGSRIARSRSAPRTGYYTRETRGCYRQVFQPPFQWPTSCKQLWSCASNDLLCLYVGLCNVLVLQFILVVLVFFAHEELSADTFQHSSRASSNARGLAW